MELIVIFNLFLISIISVFIVDISGAVESFKTGFKWLITKGKMSDSNYILKPFDCSLCVNFWSSLIYLMVIGKFTLEYITIVCLLCCFLNIIKSTILLVEDIMLKINKTIYRYFID